MLRIHTNDVNKPHHDSVIIKAKHTKKADNLVRWGSDRGSSLAPQVAGYRKMVV